MKKVTYLLVLMFSLVTMFTSCEKESDENDPIVPAGITVDQLAGDWNFVSLKIEGVTYYNNAEDIQRIADLYHYGAVNFLDVNETNLILNSLCSGNSAVNYFILENNVINIEDGSLGYEVVSLNNSILTLKYLTVHTDDPKCGSILTLQHSN